MVERGIQYRWWTAAAVVASDGPEIWLKLLFRILLSLSVLSTGEIDYERRSDGEEH